MTTNINLQKYEKWFRTGFVILLILGFAFYWYDLKPSPKTENETSNARISKPQNLKEGQCVIQVLRVKGRLFEEMKNKCHILVVLDEQGLITEIIENNK